MSFKQIVIVDYTGLQGFALERLQSLSNNPIKVFNELATTDAEIIERAKDADALFVSWNTPIKAEVIKHCPDLKYIGMCCSLIDEDSANVDVRFARANGIDVRGIRDYGDEGVAEFIISELIQLLKGLGRHQWKSEPLELTRRKIGVVGMGTTGLMTAIRLQAFGAQVSYFSRSRKPEAEQLGIDYMPLPELLQHNEILSFHLPRNVQVMADSDFKLLGSQKILINTGLSLPFSKDAFAKWLGKSGNYAIFDVCGFGTYKDELIKFDNLIYTDKTSGWTREAKERLSYKVLDNVLDFLKGK